MKTNVLQSQKSYKRRVIYKEFPVNIHGEEYGYPEEKQGTFIAFTPDYKFVVIETTYGEIIHVPYDRVRFATPE